MTYYLINSNCVVETAIALEANSNYTPPAGKTLISYANSAGHGWGWDGKWLNAPPDAPTANLGWEVIAPVGGPLYANNSWQNVPYSQLQETTDLLATLASWRYDVETGGVVVANTVGDGTDWTFPTDRESQSKYQAVVINLMQPTTNAQTYSIAWKVSPTTFLTLSAAQVMNVVLTVQQHVERAFTQEAYYIGLINTSNTAALESTDFTVGWPQNT